RGICLLIKGDMLGAAPHPGKHEVSSRACEETQNDNCNHGTKAFLRSFFLEKSDLSRYLYIDKV
ncbi:MAG: hypothetical protein IKV00_00145, partial [Clostridia bacterium]|nr:hypothetical protein [Clostridia bacterium]